MVTLQTLINILADGKYHSGAALGRELGVSRAAIWKVIQKIELELGLSIFAVKGKGYRLQLPIELLARDKIFKRLSDKTKAQLQQLEIFFSIDSTNQYLNIKSLEGAPSATLALAEQQTKGQGRRGKTWVSPFGGNVYLSLLWRFQQGPAQLGCLSLCVAVAVVRALKKIGVNDAGVKWPNDIFWHNKKLAGILLEMRGEANGPSAVVIGIGVNLDLAKKLNDIIDITQQIDQPWVDLESITGTKVDRNDFTARVIDALFDVLNMLPQKQEDLLQEWQNMDVLKDKEVEVHFSDKVIKGRAMGITQQGALKVLYDNKEFVCHSGEVSIRRCNNG